MPYGTIWVQRREELAREIAELSRRQVLERLEQIHCTFPLDFDEQFLADQTLDKLRHILLAAAMHAYGDSRA